MSSLLLLLLLLSLSHFTRNRTIFVLSVDAMVYNMIKTKKEYKISFFRTILTWKFILPIFSLILAKSSTFSYFVIFFEKACFLKYMYLDSRKRVDRNGCLEGIFVSKMDVSNFVSKRVISKTSYLHSKTSYLQAITYLRQPSNILEKTVLTFLEVKFLSRHPFLRHPYSRQTAVITLIFRKIKEKIQVWLD